MSGLKKRLTRLEEETRPKSQGVFTTESVYDEATGLYTHTFLQDGRPWVVIKTNIDIREM